MRIVEPFASENLDNVLEISGFHPTVTLRSIFFQTVLVEEADISMLSKCLHSSSNCSVKVQKTRIKHSFAWFSECMVRLRFKLDGNLLPGWGEVAFNLP